MIESLFLHCYILFLNSIVRSVKCLEKTPPKNPVNKIKYVNSLPSLRPTTFSVWMMSEAKTGWNMFFSGNLKVHRPTLLPSKILYRATLVPSGPVTPLVEHTAVLYGVWSFKTLNVPCWSFLTSQLSSKFGSVNITHMLVVLLHTVSELATDLL